MLAPEAAIGTCVNAPDLRLQIYTSRFTRGPSTGLGPGNGEVRAELKFGLRCGRTRCFVPGGVQPTQELGDAVSRLRALGGVGLD